MEMKRLPLVFALVKKSSIPPWALASLTTTPWHIRFKDRGGHQKRRGEGDKIKTLEAIISIIMS